MPRSVHHLGLTDTMIEGATVALLPGDPKRVERIAAAPPLARARALADRREYRSSLAFAGDRPVLVISTGIGGPSTAIAIDELAQLGVRTFLRVGTTGAIQPEIGVGDVVISTGAVRLDGASTHYAPIEYPAVAHHDLVCALIVAARECAIPWHVGITCSSDTFYPGQERVDSFSGYVLRRFQGATEEWRRLKVLNYEMEAATIFTMCNVFGLQGGCVAGVVVNRTQGEHLTEADVELAQSHAIVVAAAAVPHLLGSE